MTKAPVRSEIQAQVPELLRLRRDLHQHPELGFEEVRTSALVGDYLESLGLPARRGVAGTGVTALVEGAQPGPTLLLRADMDALPIHEESEVAYASLFPGKMHACGHDGHTAILLCTARTLAGMRHRLGGRVKLVFQPAEEGPGGALPMIQAGVLQDPPVDAAVALHLWSTLPTGQMAVVAGPMMACADTFHIVVRGRGGHAAMPHQGVDPILAAAHLVTALQSIVSRNVDPLQPAAVTVTSFHGGEASNVIPASVELRGTVRAFEQPLRDEIRERLAALAAGVPAAFGAEGELRYQEGYPPLHNDADMAGLVERVGRELLDLPDRLTEARVLGGEDMAYFLREVPGCLFFLGAGNPAKNCVYGHHHPRFDIDEDALPLGVELLVRIVEHYLENGGSP